MNYDITSELKSVTRTRRVVNSMLWVIVAGAVFYSAMTSTPLVSAHSAWRRSGWALGILTDAAFILSISADAVLSKHGLGGGRWAVAFRWVTGLASLFLNTWSSVAIKDWVGVAIHSIAPVILICAAEVAPVYRRRFRDLELNLSEQVTQFTVTKVVSRRGSQSQSSGSQVTNEQVPSSDGSQVPGDSSPGSSSLTENQIAIRDGFLSGRKAAEVAREIGVSSSYVSREFRKIKTELELTA